ncbi:MAG TPA: PKD domain-containing protein, partial [Gemmatimonadales bacterium]|nr:PKD domain-containing protein [Gemmatimonadales bacterium]
PTGSLTVNTSTSGSSLDPNGYSVTVDGGSPQAIGINASVSYSNLTAGNHTVAISGVAANCTVGGGTSRTVSVPSGATATTTFTVTCTTPTGNLTVSASTTGSGLDSDGYTVTVAGQSKALAINGSVSFTNLAPGSYTAVLSGVAANCTVSGGTSRTVTVPSGGTATASYAVSCTAPNQAPVVNAGPDQTALTGLLYSSTQTFSDANGNGPWSYTIDWGDGKTSTGTRTSQGSFTVGHTYITIFPRSFTIRVTVTDASGASGSDTKVVTVLLL